MKFQCFIAFLVASSLAAPAFAQSATAPLNLQVPPSDMHVPAAANANANAKLGPNAPGVYYGDTSGRTYAADAPPAPPACNDATYNQPQVHGSVTTGVVGGGRWGGSFGGATVNMTKAFGSCEHPTGGMSITVGGMRNNFHPHGGF